MVVPMLKDNEPIGGIAICTANRSGHLVKSKSS